MANENDNNWENENYSEETERQTSYEDTDYSDELDSNEEYDSDDNETVNSPSDKKKQMAILLFLIIILAIIGLFLIIKLVSGGNSNKIENSAPAPSVEVNNNDLQVDLSSSFFDESSDKTADTVSIGFNDNGEITVTDENGNAQEDIVATVSDVKPEEIKTDDLFDAAGSEPEKQEVANNKSSIEQEKEQELKKKEEEDKKAQEEAKAKADAEKDKKTGKANNSIMVAWNKAARQNPFKPPVIQQAFDDKYENMDGMQFEIIEPPTRLVPDKNIEKLLQTQISGILYDESSPSAIVNLAGKDEFVKIGDEISGYKIKKITRNKVEISYKNNTYVASVGELFVPGKLEAQPAVANLNNKFAGRYKNKDVEE